MHRTGIEPMSTAYKSAAVPLHQRCWKDLRSKRWISELSNLDFALQIFWVSHQKKPKLFFEKRSSFFANQTNFFSLLESCRFWFFTSQGLWEFKKRKEFTISRIICPSNAHNSNVQSFPEIKNFFPVVWVYASYGNRIHVNSLEGGYATTTPTMLRRFTIEEINFRTFKHEFFLKHFLSVTSRKNQNNSLRSGVNFLLTRLIFSH